MKQNDFSNVASFDSSKVWVEQNHGDTFVRKRTSEKEHEQWCSALTYLQDNPIHLCSKTINACVGPIVDWNSEERIITTRLLGTNMESVIKKSTRSDRRRIVVIFREFLCCLRDIGFLWGEPAPRNMIFDCHKGIIFLVDFERNLNLRHKMVPEKEFSRYVCAYALEEFGSVLTTSEQKKVLFPFLHDEEKLPIQIQNIGSKRKQALLRHIFGNQREYCLTQLRHVEQIMLQIVSPFGLKGQLFYPLEIIDPVSEKGGPDAYAKMAVELSRFDEASSYEYLRDKAIEFNLQHSENSNRK